MIKKDKFPYARANLWELSGEELNSLMSAQSLMVDSMIAFAKSYGMVELIYALQLSVAEMTDEDSDE